MRAGRNLAQMILVLALAATLGIGLEQASAQGGTGAGCTCTLDEGSGAPSPDCNTCTCEVVPKTTTGGDPVECDSDSSLCTTEACTGTTAEGYATCEVTETVTCDPPRVCEEGGKCNAETGECEYTQIEGEDDSCPPEDAPDAPFCRRYTCVVSGGQASCETVADPDKVGSTCTTQTDGGDPPGDCEQLQCTAAGECGVVPDSGVDCDDGNPCNGPDVCDDNGECVPENTDPKYDICTEDNVCTKCVENAELDAGYECVPQGPDFECNTCTFTGPGSGKPCICKCDPSGPEPTCTLCSTNCPDTKKNAQCGADTNGDGRTDRSCTFDLTRENTGFTCGDVTCSLLCDEACGTTRTADGNLYPSSSCENGGTSGTSGGGCQCGKLGTLTLTDPNTNEAQSYSPSPGPCCRCKESVCPTT